MKRVILHFCLTFYSISYAQEIIEKPFILEHLYHTHTVDLTNTTVYQQIDNYSSIYNITNIFFSYFFTEKDHFFVSISVAIGNGIVNHTKKLNYSIEPTGANLEEYIENINNTGRKHFTEIWYHRTNKNLDFVAGIIDSASFVDENEFANDENLQFLNNAFINNPVAPMPSFNPGVYFKLSHKNLDYKILYMENKPDKGNFSVFQINYHQKNLNIRPYVYRVFGVEKESGFGISADYTLNNSGFFLRIGNSFYGENSFYSGGIQKSNNKRNERLGFGIALLNKSVNTYIGEAYYNKNLTSHLSITFDIQYMKETEEDLILGSRLYIIY